MSDSDVLVLAMNAVPPYSGEYAIPGIRFRAVRAALGVTSWGMNVLELDANNTGYPEHDHTADGQEEVYVVLEGSAVLVTPDGERVVVKGDMVRVGPSIRRKFVTREHGVTMLAIGATPGQVFVPTM